MQSLKGDVCGIFIDLGRGFEKFTHAFDQALGVSAQPRGNRSRSHKNAEQRLSKTVARRLEKDVASCYNKRRDRGAASVHIRLLSVVIGLIGVEY